MLNVSFYLNVKVKKMLQIYILSPRVGDKCSYKTCISWHLYARTLFPIFIPN